MFVLSHPSGKVRPMDGAPRLFGGIEVVKFGFQGDQCGDGVGGSGAEAALDGEALFDMDGDFGLDAEGIQGQRDHLPGGVSVVWWEHACRWK